MTMMALEHKGPAISKVDNDESAPTAGWVTERELGWRLQLPSWRQGFVVACCEPEYVLNTAKGGNR